MSDATRPGDTEAQLRAEADQLRARIADLEGMLESMTVGTSGTAQAVLDWVRSTRLPET